LVQNAAPGSNGLPQVRQRWPAAALAAAAGVLPLVLFAPFVAGAGGGVALYDGAGGDGAGAGVTTCTGRVGATGLPLIGGSGAGRLGVGLGVGAGADDEADGPLLGSGSGRTTGGVLRGARNAPLIIPARTTPTPPSRITSGHHPAQFRKNTATGSLSSPVVVLRSAPV
jgi:hypothetical protein